ncbi:MAG: hypothetical protein F4Y24_08110 [Gemmatimonadetes bacterium]|nr:hypothetical protein [Gemmatimonadota bacterium]MYG24016.1 hypothetical protein [Gemmatimonadota bacterium]MYJ39099.1 hypothetical protein [Gemmatimonadota bacterium]
MSDLRLVFLSYRGGQVVEFSLRELGNRVTLLHIAPLDYWKQEFPRNTEGAVDWERATNHLIQASKAVGEYDHGRVRGKGCWRDDGGFVLHLGDRLLPPEDTEFVPPLDYAAAHHRLYEVGLPLKGPNLKKELSDAECRELAWLFQEFGWDDGISGYLLAGWTVLAPFCGVLDQRPHVWITGPRNAAAFCYLVHPLIGDMGVMWCPDSDLGDVGSYHERKALPFLLQLDHPRWRVRRKLREVLALASSDRIHSMACLGTTHEPNLWDRDRDYVSVLSTREQPTGRRYSRRYDQTLYPASKVEHLASRLMGRTFQWLRSGRLDESIEVCRRAVCETFHSAAAGDQYGILIAGAHVLASNEPPTIQGLRSWLQRHHRAT